MSDLFFSDIVTVTYADVIIPLALPKNFTWEVPAGFLSKAVPGLRVEVNLGRTKKYAGIIKRIHQQKPAGFTPKPILNLLDEEAIVLPQQLQLWEWMADYYMCTEGEVMAAALPAHFKLSSETILVLNEEYGTDFSELNDSEYLVAEALTIQQELTISDVQQILDTQHTYTVVNQLIQKRVVHVWESLKDSYKPKKQSFVVLNSPYENEKELAILLNEDKKLQRAAKQMELLLAYLHLTKTVGDVSKAGLLEKSGASDAQLKGLVDKGIVSIEQKDVDRILYLPKKIAVDFDLSESQQTAYNTICQSFDSKPVCLLHGVTASGKTNIYIKLIESIIREGKQALFMLPEVALTSQIIRRLQQHFGGYIGVYHYKFSQNERVEIWDKVKSGELKVVLGARSSLLLPFKDLALIICDEEHDSSYKQTDTAPRYHARDAAIYLAGQLNARILLGSATPSIESYAHARKGKYGLAVLNNRYGDVEMPHIELVDQGRIFYKEKEESIISPPLQAAITKVLNEQKQVILFQNRRGYAPYKICTSCGTVPKCNHCAVSLTYHKLSNKLLCHYCGTKYSVMLTCSACGGHTFKQQNFGTEKIEEILRVLFPEARVARMDVDTVRGKYAHSQFIQDFEQHRVDILVGTQMVVKGLDFANVALVGILDADGLLSFADFRVNERAFQLMEQVSGRAGRKDGKGYVMIQTYKVDHPVLQLVQQHDYIKMFEQEIAQRQQFHYPPYSRVIKLSLKHKNESVVDAAAQFLGKELATEYINYMNGPAPPVINRIRNQYIMEFLLKLPPDHQFIKRCKQKIMMSYALMVQEKAFKSVLMIADVDTI